ncbi:MAG: hypothetical protein AAGJ38_02755 [Planctomycetota bacterium]
MIHAYPLTLAFVLDPAWRVGVRLQLTIDGLEQPDRITPDAVGNDPTYGSNDYGDGPYGHADPRVYGSGLYGAGVYGVGAATQDHRTVQPHDAGFRTLEASAFDIAGNASAAAGPAVVLHTPDCPTPQRLRVDGSTLRWSWP